VKKLSHGRQAAARGPPPKFRQTLGNALSALLSVVIPPQSKTENFSMLRLRRSPMLSRSHAQAANDILIQVANPQRRHADSNELERTQTLQ
jgi:hypothetical protein